MVSSKIFNLTAVAVVFGTYVSATPIPTDSTKTQYASQTPPTQAADKLATRGKLLDAALAGAKEAGRTFFNSREIKELEDLTAREQPQDLSERGKFMDAALAGAKAAGKAFLNDREFQSLASRDDLTATRMSLDTAINNAYAAEKKLFKDRSVEGIEELDARDLMTIAALKLGKAALAGGQAAYHSLNGRELEEFETRGKILDSVIAGAKAAGQSLLNDRDLEDLEILASRAEPHNLVARGQFFSAALAGAKAASQAACNTAFHRRDLEELEDIVARGQFADAAIAGLKAGAQAACKSAYKTRELEPLLSRRADFPDDFETFYARDLWMPRDDSVLEALD